jgi:DNA-binding transcriptional LysR family regulator
MIPATVAKHPRRTLTGALALLFLPGCSQLPQDMDGTLRIMDQRGSFEVGIAGAMPPEARRLLTHLEQATGSKVDVRSGSLEPLIDDLETGRLDLVIAPFRKDSPLVADVALSPALSATGTGDQPTQWHAAMRNGENRWIMLVETNVRDLQAGSQ